MMVLEAEITELVLSTVEALQLAIHQESNVVPVLDRDVPTVGAVVVQSLRITADSDDVVDPKGALGGSCDDVQGQVTIIL
jgi:hypothetical protein